MNVVLETADASSRKRIQSLYKSAFPPEERMPFFLLWKKAAGGKAHLLTIKDGKDFIGFVYLICHLDLVYLFFFAIDEPKRGMGYGGKILTALQERYRGKRLFLAREQLDKSADNYEQRVKRRNFYLHNGFQDLPCKIKEAGVVYDVMSVGGTISAKEYDALMTRWSGALIRKLVDMRILE